MSSDRIRSELLRQIRRGREILVSFTGRLPSTVGEALEARHEGRVRIELFAQRPYDIEALASLREKGFLVHPQKALSEEVVIINRRYHYALRTGEPQPGDPALAAHLFAMRERELAVITGRVRRCDDRAGILVLEDLEHLTFDVRCRLPVVRGQWARVLGERPLSPLAPSYLPHTLRALEVQPLVRPATSRAVLADELPPGVVEQWDAILRDRGFIDLEDAAAYLQQHHIHPEAAVRAVAPEASRITVWALVAATALVLQQDVAEYGSVKSGLLRSLSALRGASCQDGEPGGGLTPRLGLEPSAFEAAIAAVALEVVTAILKEPEPWTGFSARTGT
jgi:hypothetical protein